MIEPQAVVEYAGTVAQGTKALQMSRNGAELSISVDLKNTREGIVWKFAENDDDVSGLKVTSFHGLRLALPANIIKKLKVSTTSGDIKVKDVALDDLKITATSGDVTVTEATTNSQASVQTSSGDIDVDGFKGRLQTRSTSGEISAEGVTADEIEVKSTSGDINLKVREAGSLLADATSGDISVSLADPTGWKFSLSATSGSIKNEFGDDVNATKRMQIRSTSGDIRITR